MLGSRVQSYVHKKWPQRCGLLFWSSHPQINKCGKLLRSTATDWYSSSGGSAWVTLSLGTVFVNRPDYYIAGEIANTLLPRTCSATLYILRYCSLHVLLSCHGHDIWYLTIHCSTADFYVIIRYSTTKLTLAQTSICKSHWPLIQNYHNKKNLYDSMFFYEILNEGFHIKTPFYSKLFL